MKNYKQKEIGSEAKENPKVPTVAKYMAKKLITFREDTSVETVVSTLLKNKITGAPVLDEKGIVLGVIDDKDCLRLITERVYHNAPPNSRSAQEYMSDIMKLIPHDTSIVDAANIFLTTPYKRLLIIDDKKDLIGIVSRHHILAAVLDF